MRRRQLIAGTAGVLLNAPFAAFAQQKSIQVIGMLATSQVDLRVRSRVAFQQGLREVGYIEGQNLLIERRGAGGQYQSLPGLLAELIHHPVEALVCGGVPATLAAKSSGTKLPVIFYLGADPVELELVESLNRPGRNFTGVTLLSAELAPKRLELMHELVPSAQIFALLINPDNRSAEGQWKEMLKAASALQLRLVALRASAERNFDDAFADARAMGVGGIVIGADGLFVSQSERLGELATRHAIPTVFQFPEFAAAGGLASYGGSVTDAYRQVGIYTGRVLKGERPAELPVQRVAKVDMIINIKAAKALGLSIPLPLLGRADEVIE